MAILRFDTAVGGSGVAGSAPNSLSSSFVYDVAVSGLDAVYMRADGILGQADASAVATSGAVGFVSVLDVPVLGEATVIYSGELAGFVGLERGKNYVLGLTPGLIVAEDDTANPDYPDTAGQVKKVVGRALTTTKLFVDVSRMMVEL